MAMIPSPFGTTASPVGPASGDLKGSYPSPQVASATHMVGATTSTAMIDTSVTGDTMARFNMNADGGHSWGGGTGATDVNWYRATVGQLNTDNTLQVGTDFRVAGNTTLAGTASLGDNGVGVVRVTNASTPPTVNPTGGVVMYAVSGAGYSRSADGFVTPLNFGAEPAVAVTGAQAESVRRLNVSSSFTPATGSLYLASIFLSAGQSIGHVGVVSVGANATMTHWWTTLLDNTFTQRAHSADQLTTSVAANTWYSLAMVTPFTATYSGAYYLGITAAFTGMAPTWGSSAGTPNAGLYTGTNVIGPPPNGLSSTGLTVPGTDGTTVYATPTTGINTIYMYALA